MVEWDGEGGWEQVGQRRWEGGGEESGCDARGGGEIWEGWGEGGMRTGLRTIVEEEAVREGGGVAELEGGSGCEGRSEKDGRDGVVR